MTRKGFLQMKTCTKCGKVLNENEICDCQRQAYMNYMNKLKKLFIIALTSQIITFILWFVPAMKVASVYSETLMGGSLSGTTTYHVTSQTISLSECWEGITAGLIISLALMASSAVFLALPIIKNQFRKFFRLVFTKISAFWTAFIFILVMISGISSAAEYGEYGAEFSLTFGGILLIISIITEIVTAFIISKQTKRFVRKKLKAEFSSK